MVKAMREVGIDISEDCSKSADEFTSQRVKVLQICNSTTPLVNRAGHASSRPIVEDYEFWNNTVPVVASATALVAVLV